MVGESGMYGRRGWGVFDVPYIYVLIIMSHKEIIAAYSLSILFP